MSNNCKPVIEDYNQNGLEGLMFSAGGYRAVVLPHRGANVVLLDNITLGANILRTPPTKESYDKTPALYGIPVLFPPNRIDMGKFTACGRNYNFPVNETERNNHLHGFLSDAPWNIENKEVTADYAEITLSFENTGSSHFFEYYPHLFKITIVNRLSADGLFQDVSIINNGNTDMPLGLGFHTTFNLPFHPDGIVDNIRLMMTVEGKWELDERMLPTGKKLFPQDWEGKLGQDGIIPLEHPLDNHYPAKPMQQESGLFNGAILTDFSTGLRIIYEAGKSFKHWMLYNGMENRKDFVCPEPQTWMVNAPNIDKPLDETGLIILSPGKTWTDFTKIKVEKLDK